jgi:Domain of unknown function (DUF4494)
MNNWFTVKVKYTKQLDNGALKRVSEPYLLAAMTFTDAEARIYEELGTIIRGEFNVTGIARTEIHDIFAYDDSGVWYKCKATYDNIDADTEKSKKVSQNFLVEASSVKEAFDRLTESLKGMLVEFQIPSIMISPIIDIFPYSEEMDKEISRRPITDEERATFDTPSESEEEVEEEENSGVVFSASGSDIEDEDDVDDEGESEIEDNFDEE